MEDGENGGFRVRLIFIIWRKNFFHQGLRLWRTIEVVTYFQTEVNKYKTSEWGGTNGRRDVVSSTTLSGSMREETVIVLQVSYAPLRVR